MSYLDKKPQNKQSLVVFMKEMCYRDHIFFFCQLVGKKCKNVINLNFYIALRWKITTGKLLKNKLN